MGGQVGGDAAMRCRRPASMLQWLSAERHPAPWIRPAEHFGVRWGTCTPLREQT